MSSLNQPVTIQRIWLLEALRGVLSWWVVLDHVRAVLPYSYPTRFESLIWGGHAVNVFVILSGFVITLLVLKEEKWNTFIVRRFFRLWPIFMVCLTSMTFAPNHFPPSDRTLAILANIFMLHGVIPEHASIGTVHLLGPSWSISLEWQFYLIAPFIISAVIRSKIWPSMLLILCIAIVWSKCIENAYHFPSFLPLGIPYFAIGIASCLFWRVANKSGFIMPFSATVCFIPLLAFFSKNIAVTIWCTALLAILPGSLANRLDKIKDSVPARWICGLGRISYPTYLCHWPVLLILSTYTGIGTLLPCQNQYLGLILAFCIMLLPIMAISWILHVCVENPGNRLGSKVVKRM